MSAPDLAPGQIVAGTYGIQSRLGNGGGAMATYHAMTAPNRQVALKLYDPAVRSFPDILKMLGRYQMTTAALASRSIAPITESGEDPSTGAPFTVTDLEAHPNLTDLVELCPLSTSEMVALMGNLGRCVDLLHAHGIVHLALHPNNIFVGPAPAYEVRVLDFGSGAVRKALQAREKSEQRAPWLAPEQIENDPICDARADVFAAALVAFFAASGRSYWRSCQQGELDLGEFRREVLGPRVPASERAKELSLALSPTFDAVFARALAVSPRDRFGTVGELAGALALAERGLGFPSTDDVPPPPAQMEAVLRTFEGDRSAAAVPSSDTKESFAEQAGFAHVDDVEDLAIDDRVGRAARTRLVYGVGIAALLLGMGGVFALFSRGKPPAARATVPSAPAPMVAVSSSPVETTPALPSPPVPAAVAEEPTPEAQPAPSASTVPSARPPVWRRPPAAPRPPAKKPCGKFLKRCT